MSSVKIDDHTLQLIANLKTRGPIALRMMLDDIGTAADPNTPRDKGDLRFNKLKQVLGLHGVIQWRQRYAAAQEDKQHTHYTTPGTGPHFAENAVKKVAKDIQSYLDKAAVL